MTEFNESLTEKTSGVSLSWGARVVRSIGKCLAMGSGINPSGKVAWLELDLQQAEADRIAAEQALAEGVIRGANE